MPEINECSVYGLGPYVASCADQTNARQVTCETGYSIANSGIITGPVASPGCTGTITNFPLLHDVDISECSQANPCGPDAECTEIVPDERSCICTAGHHWNNSGVGYFTPTPVTVLGNGPWPDIQHCVGKAQFELIMTSSH